MWVHRHEPDVSGRIAHVLLPKDHVRFGLTGDLATDRADAAGTLLLSLADRDRSPEDELVEEASGVPAGSEGLLFLPYLTGKRTPHPDPLARGAFVSLTILHGLPHLVRAVLEGVAFGLRDSFELMDAVGSPRPAHVRITGGGSRSALWRRVLADVVRTSVVTTSSAEGAAQGAATLAAVGAGWFPTVDAACDATIELGEPIDPGPDADSYDDGYGRYRTLYPALRPTFHATPV